MRALAEYVMKGRAQAALVAAIATGTVLFAWVGAAVIALVTLRRGSSQGANVLLWSLLPAAVVAAWGDTGPITTLLGVMLAATALRVTSSWSWALMAAVISGVLTALVMITAGAGYVEMIVQLVADTIVELGKQAEISGQQAAAIPQPTAQQIAGLLGLSNAFTVVMCLMLGRWWQGMLYNPGGFQKEFHQLRLLPPLTVVLLVAGIVLASLGADFRIWAVIFAIPFIFAGFALLHGVVAARGLTSKWLVIFYISWLVLDPVKVIVFVLVVVDSWINIRGRLAVSGSGPQQ